MFRPDSFFKGSSDAGASSTLWVLVFSAAISWIFEKSIANAANFGQAFGITGGIGYATYYLSFVVAEVAIYFIRVKGGFGSLASFLIAKYADDLGINVYGLLIAPVVICWARHYSVAGAKWQRQQPVLNHPV